MVFKPAHLEVNPHALDPNDVYKGLNLSGVCPWIELLKGDPKYSGLNCKNSLKIDPSFDLELKIGLENTAAVGGGFLPPKSVDCLF